MRKYRSHQGQPAESFLFSGEARKTSSSCPVSMVYSVPVDRIVTEEDHHTDICLVEASFYCWAPSSLPVASPSTASPTLSPSASPTSLLPFSHSTITSSCWSPLWSTWSVLSERAYQKLSTALEYGQACGVSCEQTGQVPCRCRRRYVSGDANKCSSSYRLRAVQWTTVLLHLMTVLLVLLSQTSLTSGHSALLHSTPNQTGPVRPVRPFTLVGGNWTASPNLSQYSSPDRHSPHNLSLSSTPLPPISSQYHHLHSDANSAWNDPEEAASSAALLEPITEESIQLAIGASGVVQVEVCTVCWCNKEDELDCRYRTAQSNKIQRIPTLPTREERLRIVEM